MLIGLVTLAFSFSSTEKDNSGQNSISINQSNINSPHAVIGDPTNTAKDRFEKSQLIIKNEIINNFSDLSNIVFLVSSKTPKPFLDKRRPNETELMYQDRAKNNFRNYIDDISKTINFSRFSQLAYSSNRTNISYSIEADQNIEKIYFWQNESLDSLKGLVSALQNLMNLPISSDTERTERAKLISKEIILDAKRTLATALSFFSTVANQQDALMLNATLVSLSEKDTYTFAEGVKGFQDAMRLAGSFVEEKTMLLTSQTIQIAKKREISRLITDPYLVMLRQQAGLPSTLTEGELMILQSKEINTNETDPSKLVEMAGLAYLESDGEATKTYLARALAHPELNSQQNLMLQAAIKRLENPNIYEGSLGILVLDIEKGGAFENSNIKYGDVLIKIDEKPIDDPFEIANKLANLTTNHMLVTLLRNNEKLIMKVNTGKSANATITTLIIFNKAKI